MCGPTTTPINWSKPPKDWIKCNVAASWSDSSVNSGGAWVLWNDEGSALMHSRRSFSQVANPLEAELTSLLWSIEDMQNLRFDKVFLETSSISLRDALLQPMALSSCTSLVSRILNALNGFTEWKLEHVALECNKAASLIAQSVTEERHYQSYVASGGPSWLRTLLEEEARCS